MTDPYERACSFFHDSQLSDSNLDIYAVWFREVVVDNKRIYCHNGNTIPLR